MGVLLILEGPMLPLVCDVKLLAVLVLLPVSAVSGVVALNVVPAKTGREKRIRNSKSRIRFNLRTHAPVLARHYHHEPSIYIGNKSRVEARKLCASLTSM